MRAPLECEATGFGHGLAARVALAMCRTAPGLLLLTACATQQPGVVPALLNPRLNAADVADRSVVTGHVIAHSTDPRGFHVVIVDKKGNPYNVLVLHLTEPGRTEDGDEVTVWCRGAAGDLVADSMRVDAHPARQRSPEPPPYQPPAMPPR